ncbi:hypothetical protein Tco_0197053, partial [Tanacetum coccineum]
KAIKGNRKTTKETPTTITITTTITTTTTTETTAITNNKTGGRKLPGPMLHAPAEGMGYAGNLPKCNRCNSHHNGQCPPKCQKCQRTGHREKGCRVRVPGAGVTPLQDVTCYGCGEK